MSVLEPSDPDYWTPDPFFAGVAAAAAAHDLRIRHHALGPLDDEDATPVAAMLEMPPGYELPRHAHDCERIEIVVKGSLEVDGRVLGPGAVLRSGAGDFYGPHVAGPHGCTTVEVFASLRGVGRVMLATDDGPAQVAYRDGPQGGTDRAGSGATGTGHHGR